MREPTFYLAGAALAAGLAGAFSAAVTPWVRRCALRYGAAHAPRARDVHREPVPRWGGLAIFAAFVVSLVVSALVVQYVFHRPIMPRTMWAGVGLVLAGTLLTVVGALDDRIELSAGKQLAAQVGCAVLVTLFGIRVDFVTHPLTGQMVALGWVAYPLTVAWLVAVANAVNWIDGIDGLAAGVCAISALCMALMAAWSSQPGLTVFAAALCGSLLGFLRYNFNPARIFMGGGAQVVGFVLASIAAVGAFKAPVALSVALPLLILALPLFDTATVITRRALAGRPIYQADKSHLHHRLLAMGYSQRQTVIILYAISLSFGVVALAVFLLAGTGG
jgi:UDP-GlcNAc:undecaprenyl-phosphate GlcNAc-1-phosphate transferase